MKRRTVPIRVNGEYLLWLFTRISALVMYLLVFLAIGGALILGARRQMTLADLLRWGFMPNISHVLNTNIASIEPWATSFWRAMAICMFFFASAHGLRGLLSVAEDYLTRPRLRRILRTLVFCIWLAFLAIGSFVILSS